MAKVPDRQKPAAVPAGSRAGDIDSFLARVRSIPPVAHSGRGRLVFALDATMSRQATWDLAQSLQGEMFSAAGRHGGLDVQLVYFRGYGECRASRFVAGGEGLARLMAQIDCRGGHTQIGKVLAHVRDEHARAAVGALVYVGDAMEEDVDALAQIAGELGILGVKAFMFQEGHDPVAEHAFREIARLSGGAYAAFDASSAARLAELLAAAAAYAAGGRAALQAQGGGEALKLLGQMR